MDLIFENFQMQFILESIKVFLLLYDMIMFCSQADESYLIGPAASQLSYLRKDKILEVAKHSGAQVY